MERTTYIENKILRLCKPIASVDDIDDFACWNDPDTMEAFNHRPTESFEAYTQGEIQSRWSATIVRISDDARIGSVFLSPEWTSPDLAIMIYKPYRNQGYGTQAFSLGLAYCFDTLLLSRVHAGCYTHNLPSLAMLKKCGFIPHPQGDTCEKHHSTGADILQLDFVLDNPIRDIKRMFNTPEAYATYRECMYMPTWEGFRGRASDFLSRDSVHIYGFMDGHAIAGILAIEMLSESSAEIHGIAVNSGYRSRGIGRRLLRHACRALSISDIHAETDGDAVGFYQRCGFAARPFMKNDACLRYDCNLQVRPDPR